MAKLSVGFNLEMTESNPSFAMASLDWFGASSPSSKEECIDPEMSNTIQMFNWATLLNSSSPELSPTMTKCSSAKLEPAATAEASPAASPAEKRVSKLDSIRFE